MSRGARLRTALTGAVLASLVAVPALAITQVAEGDPGRPRVSVDVWINKEEGGVYQPGENMQVFFRSNANAYVLVYNIDTEGYIHLIYPYGPSDPPRVEGGQSYRIPARHDPYDLVADGPPGMEFVVAVASRYPFRDLPWFLEPGVADASDQPRSDDELDSGVIVGDPYVGMERLNRRILPPSGEEDSDANETYFYINRRVDYPRYVCADCHYQAFGFDPYLSACPVVEIRVDATWVHYAPVRVGVARPRYYYWVRSGAPDRYRQWKDRWSSLDGAPALRSRFVLEPSPKLIRYREQNGRRVPPEFQNLRRNRPGRLWQGRDEVLRLWQDQRRNRDNVAPPFRQYQGQGRGDQPPGFWQRGAPPRDNSGSGDRRRYDSPPPQQEPQRQREQQYRERQDQDQRQRQEQHQERQRDHVQPQDKGHGNGGGQGGNDHGGGNGRGGGNDHGGGNGHGGGNDHGDGNDHGGGNGGGRWRDR